MANHLVALALFSVEWDRIPNVYVAQITHIRGVMEWMLVEDATNVHKIAGAICSRLSNMSVLLWSECKAVRSAAMRFAKRRGACLGWSVFNPETHEPPRWPSCRGDSCIEGGRW